MKKTFLTLITILAFIISNAQVKTKANHNTTRSNQTSGIMAREIKEMDCNRILDSKFFIKVPKTGEPELHFNCCKVASKSWEDATASAVKEASKAHAKKHLFSKNKIVYYYNEDLRKLNKCKVQLKKANWIEIESSSTTTKSKKRNKNFNRKGERVRRTTF